MHIFANFYLHHMSVNRLVQVAVRKKIRVNDNMSNTSVANSKIEKGNERRLVSFGRLTKY